MAQEALRQHPWLGHRNEANGSPEASVAILPVIHLWNPGDHCQTIRALPEDYLSAGP